MPVSQNYKIIKQNLIECSDFYYPELFSFISKLCHDIISSSFSWFLRSMFNCVGSGMNFLVILLLAAHNDGNFIYLSIYIYHLSSVFSLVGEPLKDSSFPMPM